MVALRDDKNFLQSILDASFYEKRRLVLDLWVFVDCNPTKIVKDNNKKGQLKNDVDEEKNEDRDERSLEKLSFIVHFYPLVFKKTKECAIYQLDAARNNVNSLKPFKLGPVSGGKISFTLLRLVVGSVYTKLNQQKGEQQDTYLAGITNTGHERGSYRS